MSYNTMLRDLAKMNTAMNTVMNDAMNRMFERANSGYDYTHNGGSYNGNNGASVQSPTLTARLPLDVQANENEFVFTAYLPGVKPESVEITFEQDELTIKGQFPAAPEGNGFLKTELFHGAFERKLSFNTPVNGEAIDAQFENGVLTLRVPKAEVAKPKKIAINAK